MQIITATKLEDVLPALETVEKLVNLNNWYAAGFLSYESAPAFDNALMVHPDNEFPLLWFGLYSEPQRTKDLPSKDGEYHLEKWIPTTSPELYNSAIQQIKNQIAKGNSYQVNYTFRLKNHFSGSAWSMFVDMVNAQGPGYSAFLDIGKFTICSASPELFFSLNDDVVTCRPMKGTVKRGTTLADDKSQAEWLQNSSKNRAENIMIVDMIRNDLGRLAKIGSVTVPDLFAAERYPTLWQMTSRITAEISEPVSSILKVLFPCASITGAPKISTMQIISQLETTPRRIYTGTIGYLAPNRKAQFSVAIRSVLIDQEINKAEYGLGGGIVWDSTCKDEFAEALLKARIITEQRPEFSLIETMRWTPNEGFFLLREHLQRLKDSAEYFNFVFDLEKITIHLNNAVNNLVDHPHRIRLILDRDGNLSNKVFQIQEQIQESPLRLKIAAEPIRSDDIFLYHKTTQRQVYELARLSQTDCDDVILYNESNEVTETSIANLVFEFNGQLLTPPIACGLLPGTLRAHLLNVGKIKEKVIKLAELQGCTQIFLINSVRGWQQAQIVDQQNINFK
ncbi:MAG: aminodeoxychorismate synthase component I [Chloroflexota bacterium]